MDKNNRQSNAVGEDAAENFASLDGESSETAQVADSHDIRDAIGQEIKFWRRERGMTGAKVAANAGVSAGMLTKIEKGKVAPSILTLTRIADALNIPVSMLFYRLQKSRYVSFVPAGQGLITDASGTRANHVSEMLGHNVGHTLGLEPFLIRIDENSVPFTSFQEEGFKFVHMLEGEARYVHGDRSFHLKPGDSLTFDAMSPHGPAQHIRLPIVMMSILVYSRFEPGTR